MKFKLIVFSILCLVAFAARSQTLYVCVGSTLTPPCASSIGTYTGTWSSSDPTVASVDISTGLVTGVSAGTAVISYSFGISGCGSGVFTSTVSVLTSPVASPSTNSPVCSGGTLNLFAGDTYVAGTTYSWSGPNSFTSALENPSISSVTPMASGVYSVTITNPGGCSATFTTPLVIIGTPFTLTGVDEISPFNLSGQSMHTYRNAGGFTLSLTSIPTLPVSGISCTWRGSIMTTTVGSANYSPTYTSGSSTIIDPNVITVSWNGCVDSLPDTIVIPATGCDPNTYFNVNDLRASRGQSPVPGCIDCNDTQPFYTITSSILGPTFLDNRNYYIINSASMTKPSYTHCQFYMNQNTHLTIGAGVNTTIDSCHFYSDCEWYGIEEGVTGMSAASLTLKNSLIENAGSASNPSKAGINIEATGGGYYMLGMRNILDCDGNVFNNNYKSIHIKDYTPIYNAAITQYPFNIVNTVFTNRDFTSGGSLPSTALVNYPFMWPSTTNLKTITSPSTLPVPFSYHGVPAFTNLDAYTPTAYNIYGICLENVGANFMISPGTSTMPAIYAYNNTRIGSIANDASYSITNLFDHISFGVELLSSNAQLFNNTFRNMDNAGTSYENPSNSFNGVQIAGSSVPATNTNNRYYNCNRLGVSCTNGSMRDFICINAQFTSDQNLGTNIAISLINAGNDEHGVYSISNNFIYNYGNGVYMDALTPGTGIYTALNGGVSIDHNVIHGKTSNTSPELVTMGIWYLDQRTYGFPGANGSVDIAYNDEKGTQMGIITEASTETVNITHNNVTSTDYPTGGYYKNADFYTRNTPYLNNVTDNIATAWGYSCTPTAGGDNIGMYFDNVGTPSSSANISCNAVHDINVGFEFVNNNTLQWTQNQMMRNQKGMYLDGTIGTQGSICAPSDNHWDNGTCSICWCAVWPTLGWSDPSIFQTYVGTSGVPGTSALYVRIGTPNYDPFHNGAATGATAYAAPATLLDVNTLCTSTLPPFPTCAQNPGFRAAPSPSSPANGGTKLIRSGIEEASQNLSEMYTLYPNPNEGNLTISSNTTSGTPVDVSVYNTLGQQVYNGTLQLQSGKADIKMSNATPGLYQVKISNSKGESWNKKVIVGKVK